MTKPETRKNGGMTVTILPDDSFDVEQEFARAFALGTEVLESGTLYHKSYFRRLGWLRLMVVKEVGPPPWPWPKLKVHGSRGPLFVAFGAGWRSTLYSLYIMVK